MSYTEQTAAPHGGSNTITALYDDRSEADSAIERLAGAGIPRSSIQIIADTLAPQRQSKKKRVSGPISESYSSRTTTARPTLKASGAAATLSP